VRHSAHTRAWQSASWQWLPCVSMTLQVSTSTTEVSLDSLHSKPPHKRWCVGRHTNMGACSAAKINEYDRRRGFFHFIWTHGILALIDKHVKTAFLIWTNLPVAELTGCWSSISRIWWVRHLQCTEMRFRWILSSLIVVRYCSSYVTLSSMISSEPGRWKRQRAVIRWTEVRIERLAYYQHHCHIM